MFLDSFALLFPSCRFHLTWNSVPDLIDWSDAAGKTALHMACQSGNSDLVQVSLGDLVHYYAPKRIKN
jgi:hypothetical protein